MHVLLEAGAEDWMLRNAAGIACIEPGGPDEEGDPDEGSAPLRLRPGAPGDPRAYRTLRGGRVALHLRRDVLLDAVHGLDIVWDGGRPVVRAVRIERRV